MDILIKINSQTNGRDKQIRLLQYLSRFLWHRLHLKGKKDANLLQTLEYNFSTFRKLLRLGKCVDSLYTVLPVLHHPDATVRLTISLSKISNSLYLLIDHILWAGRAGVCEVDTSKWSELSNRFWLYSLTLNLTRDVYEIYQIIQTDVPNVNTKLKKETLKSLFEILVCIGAHKNVVIDTIKNGCDILIPLTALGYTKLSPSTVGILGVISSIAGLLVLIEPKYKLSPT